MSVGNFNAAAIRFSNIERVLHSIKSEQMAKYGLRHTHLVCMVYIDQSEDGLTPTEISKICDFDKAFVSRITSELIQKNIIKINDKFNDGIKYKQKFVLDQAGVEIMNEINEIMKKVSEKALEGIPVDELKIFKSVLFSISDKIDLISDEFTN